MQTTRPLRDGGIWIEGRVEAPPEGTTGPMVIGRDWLLEMVQSNNGRTYGFFFAPFAIIRDLPELDRMLNGRFVGFSQPCKPPASWLTESAVFGLETLTLARTPSDFIALMARPRPFVSMEGTASVSHQSRKAKYLIAENFLRDMSIAEVADALHVSHAHLTRQFKRDFGITPIAYQHGLRVSEAMGRLCRGEDILEAGY